jgi:hypothetical protein
MKPAAYFTLADAWLLVALFMYDVAKAEVDLPAIIARGDALNHAVFTVQELQTGFINLQAGGWIAVDGNMLNLTERSTTLKEQFPSRKGGLFSQVEQTLRKMNASPMNSLGRTAECAFLTEENITRAYRTYIDSLNGSNAI